KGAQSLRLSRTRDPWSACRASSRRARPRSRPCRPSVGSKRPAARLPSPAASVTPNGPDQPVRLSQAPPARSSRGSPFPERRARRRRQTEKSLSSRIPVVPLALWRRVPPLRAAENRLLGSLAHDVDHDATERLSRPLPCFAQKTLEAGRRHLCPRRLRQKIVQRPRERRPIFVGYALQLGGQLARGRKTSRRPRVRLAAERAERRPRAPVRRQCR